MITRYMNTAEIVKELIKDDEFLLGRMDGLGIKNNKKLKNRFVKSGDVMSISHYVIPETKDNAVVFAIKYVDTISGKATMLMNYYIKTYYGTYVLPLYTGFLNHSMYGYIEFTCHAVERIWERLGKDFETFFNEDFIQKSHSTVMKVEYSHNGDENESVARIGDAFAFIETEEDGKKTVIKTIITDRELLNFQVGDKEASISGAETAHGYMCSDLSRELCKSHSRLRSVS